MKKRNKTKQGPSRWFILVLVAYAALAISLGVLRLSAVAADDTASRWTELATAVVMILATIGPAFLAELLLRRLAPVAQLTRHRRDLRRRLRDARRKHERAKAKVRFLARLREAWDAEAARLHAVYTLTHRTATARLNGRSQEEQR